MITVYKLTGPDAALTADRRIDLASIAERAVSDELPNPKRPVPNVVGDSGVDDGGKPE